MEHTINKSRSAIGAGFALALLISIPLGAQTLPPVTFNLTNVEGESLAGVYTSPYIGNVNGGATIPVICDDFSDNSYLPESCSAYETTLSTVITSTPPSLSYLKWNGANSQGSVDGSAGWDLTQAEAYTVAATLTLEILQLNDPGNPTYPAIGADPSEAQKQIDLSFALWELFDPTAAAGALVIDGGDANWGSNSDAVVPWLTTTYSYPNDLKAATLDVENAISATANGTNESGLDGYQVTIYSYNSSL